MACQIASTLRSVASRSASSGTCRSDDFPLAGAWTQARALRLADGPDEVHRGVIARLELGKYGARR